MRAKLHAMAGIAALVCILVFWTASLAAELFLDLAGIASVKAGILTAMSLFIPLMAATGASGFALGRHRPGKLVDRKLRRMRIAAANGILILLPCAIALHALARAGDVGTTFQLLQGLELVAGAVNIALLALNVRDGLRLSGRGAGRSWPGKQKAQP